MAKPTSAPGGMTSGQDINGRPYTSLLRMNEFKIDEASSYKKKGDEKEPTEGAVKDDNWSVQKDPDTGNDAAKGNKTKTLDPSKNTTK